MNHAQLVGLIRKLQGTVGLCSSGDSAGHALDYTIRNHDCVRVATGTFDGVASNKQQDDSKLSSTMAGLTPASATGAGDECWNQPKDVTPQSELNHTSHRRQNEEGCKEPESFVCDSTEGRLLNLAHETATSEAGTIVEVSGKFLIAKLSGKTTVRFEDGTSRRLRTCCTDHAF